MIEPSAGSLACGEIGPGRLAEPDDIVADLLGRLPGVARPAINLLRPGPARPHHAGGTKVPIDGVRAITNTSSGRTGATLAEQFARAGTTSRCSTPPARRCRIQPTDRSGDVRSRRSTSSPVRSTSCYQAGRFGAVIHLAAVSDFAVDHLVVDGAPATVDTSGKLDTGDVHGDPPPAHAQAARPAQGARW